MWDNVAFFNIHSIVCMFFSRIQSDTVRGELFSKWMFLKFLNLRFFLIRNFLEKLKFD